MAAGSNQSGLGMDIIAIKLARRTSQLPPSLAITHPTFNISPFFIQISLTESSQYPDALIRSTLR